MNAGFLCQACFLSESGLFGQTGFLGKTGLFGQACLFSQASFLSKSGLFGQACFLCETSLFGKAFFLGKTSLFGQACFLSKAFLFLSAFSFLFCKSSLAGFLFSETTNSFVDGFFVFVSVAIQDRFAHLEKFLIDEVGNFLFPLHQETFNILNRKLAVMFAEVLRKDSVEFSLFTGNSPVLGHKILKGGQNFCQIQLFDFSDSTPPFGMRCSRTFHQVFLALTQPSFGQLVLRVDAENGFPCCFGLVHVAKPVMVGSDLKTSVEMMAVAADRRLKV